MGKPRHEVWAHVKPNPDPETRDTYPYVDLYAGEKHTHNATRLRCWLAFDCPQFEEQQPAAHHKLLLGLKAENIKQRKPADQDRWLAAQKAAAGAAGTGAGASVAGSNGAGPSDSHLPNALVSAGAYASSVICAGKSAAELRLGTKGVQRTLDALVDRIDPAEVEQMQEPSSSSRRSKSTSASLSGTAQTCRTACTTGRRRAGACAW